MRNEDLIKEFASGGTKGTGSNLRIEGNLLINYKTVIAARVPGGVILNTYPYSATTAKNQTYMRRSAVIVGESWGEQELKRSIKKKTRYNRCIPMVTG